jgi:methyl-accepting chemotaxis protein
VTDVDSHIDRLLKRTEDLKGAMTRLDTRVQDIDKVLTVISDIADQTNLLALNAAIEAARAGEAGRGFAVVADEVRKLAEKTMEATKQVGTAIKAIQDGTSASMASMQEAANYISTSTQVAHKAGEALADIEDIVHKTAEEVRSIATASEEQSASTEEIHKRTEGIKAITIHVSESTQRSNRVVTELLALSQKLVTIVDNLQKG